MHWAKRAELMKIKNLGRDYADLLEAVGVESVADLEKPESLRKMMHSANQQKKLLIECLHLK